MLFKERFGFVGKTPLWGPAPSVSRPFPVHVWSWECGALFLRDQVRSGYFSLLGFGPCLKILLLGSGRFTCLCIPLLSLSLGLSFPVLVLRQVEVESCGCKK